MATRLDDLDAGYPGDQQQQPPSQDLADRILQQVNEGPPSLSSGGSRPNAPRTISTGYPKMLFAYFAILSLFLVITHPVVSRFFVRKFADSFLFQSHGRIMVRIAQGSILALIYICYSTLGGAESGTGPGVHPGGMAGSAGPYSAEYM